MALTLYHPDPDAKDGEISIGSDVYVVKNGKITVDSEKEADRLEASGYFVRQKPKEAPAPFAISSNHPLGWAPSPLAGADDVEPERQELAETVPPAEERKE